MSIGLTALLINRVNSDETSASDLAAQYEAAGITDLAYTPSGSTADSQTWPTLQSLISSGKRLVNFVDSGVEDNSVAPYLMPEFSYIFENPYDVTRANQFVCGANRPSNLIAKTADAVSSKMMPFMNHFLYENAGLGIQMPAVANTTITNAPSGGLGTLGYHATQCTQEYGRAPTFVLVDYFVSLYQISDLHCFHIHARNLFDACIVCLGLLWPQFSTHVSFALTWSFCQNVGPAITTVDRLNGVSNPVGRMQVSKQILTSSANLRIDTSRLLWISLLTLLLAF